MGITDNDTLQPCEKVRALFEHNSFDKWRLRHQTSDGTGRNVYPNLATCTISETNPLTAVGGLSSNPSECESVNHYLQSRVNWRGTDGPQSIMYDCALNTPLDGYDPPRHRN